MEEVSFRLSDLTEYLGGELVGDDVEITGISGIEDAEQGDITFLHSKKYLKFLKTTNASAIITSPEFELEGFRCILVDNPYLAFAKLLNKFAPPYLVEPTGISERAEISETADIGEEVTLKPFAVVEDGSEIGDNSIICEGVYVGENVIIGENSIVFPNVTIYRETVIGNSVTIHSGTVIGSDGFGYARDGNIHRKIPQIGKVVIENEVEIGSNVSIDRGTIGVTTIKKGTKIDNLVQIAHNVRIGENSIIVAQVGISGSTFIGDDVVIAGQVGIVGHIEIGDGVKIGAKSGISKDIPSGEHYFGSPARPHMEMKRIEAFLSRYQSILDRLKRIERELEIEEK